MGTINEWLATKALIVSSPRDGGESILIYLYFPIIDFIDSFYTVSRVNILTNSISAPDNLVLDGTTSRKSISEG